MMVDKKKKYDLVCYGEVLYDIYNKQGSKNKNNSKEKILSGAPLTTASIASKLGLKTGIISGINNKKEVVKKIKKEIPKPTGESIVKLDKNNNPEFKIKKDVAYDYIKYTNELKNLKTKYFYFGTLAQRNKKSRETLHKLLKKLKLKNPKNKNNKNTKTIYDVNIRVGASWKKIFKSSLKYTDILKVNEYELKEIKKLLKIEKTKDILNLKKVNYLFITKGNKGASVYYKIKSNKDSNKIKAISLP